MKLVLLSAAIALSLNVAAFAATPASPDRSGGAQSVYIEDLTWPEVKAAIAAGKTTAIVHAGSTEQNGPHMALGKENAGTRPASLRRDDARCPRASDRKALLLCALEHGVKAS